MSAARNERLAADDDSIDSRVLSSASDRLLPFDESMNNRNDDSDVVFRLFFFAAVGCTIGSISILSNLVFYNAKLGQGSYWVLNIATFAPSFPISIAQVAFDTKFDRRFNSRRSYAFRGLVGYSITILAILLLPFMSHSLPWLSFNACIMGLAGSLLHGMLKQLSSMSCHDGRLSVSVTAGMQASAIFVLGISLLTGFGRTDSTEGLTAFFLLVASLEVGCAYSFWRLMSSTPKVLNTLVRRDSSFQSMVPLLRPTTSAGDFVGTVDDDANIAHTPELSTNTLFMKTWPACLAIGLTVGSSMLVSSCFDRVQSQYTTFQALPQVLFYTRLFADLLGRPATLLLRLTSPEALMVLSILRLGFVPIFFVYTNSSIIPKNDAAAVFAIFLFSFSSGFFSTVSYQLAPVLLCASEREMNRGFQASLINLCFNFSIIVGLVASFIITGASGQ